MAWTIRQMDDFAGWPVWGWLSPGGIPCLNPVFRLGPFGSACGSCREAAPLSGNLACRDGEERINHASCETTSASECPVLEDRARSLGLGTVRRISSPS